jgi:hypothetical protein
MLTVISIISEKGKHHTILNQLPPLLEDKINRPFHQVFRMSHFRTKTLQLSQGNSTLKF